MCQNYPHRALKIALNFPEREKDPKMPQNAPNPPETVIVTLNASSSAELQILILPPVRARELLFPSIVVFADVLYRWCK